MKVVWYDADRYGGMHRVKYIADDRLADFVACGWQEVVPDPDFPDEPMSRETPIERLETAVEAMGL